MRVWLMEAKTQSLTEASFVPMTMQDLSEARETWGQEFQRRQRELARDEDLELWRPGVMGESSFIEGLVPNGYVIICAGNAQGVVAFDGRLQPSRRRSGTALLYVTYLATAPWNRTLGGRDGLFRHVGRILVAQAVRESIALGCPGRIGLHTYPSAIPFFDKLCFENCGPDPARRGMSYFELRPGQAFEILSDFGRRPGFSIERP